MQFLAHNAQNSPVPLNWPAPHDCLHDLRLYASSLGGVHVVHSVAFGQEAQPSMAMEHALQSRPNNPAPVPYDPSGHEFRQDPRSVARYLLPPHTSHVFPPLHSSHPGSEQGRHDCFESTIKCRSMHLAQIKSSAPHVLQFSRAHAGLHIRPVVPVPSDRCKVSLSHSAIQERLSTDRYLLFAQETHVVAPVHVSQSGIPEQDSQVRPVTPSPFS